MILPPSAPHAPVTAPAPARLPTPFTAAELERCELRLRLTEAKDTMRRASAETRRLIGDRGTVRPART